MGKTFGNSQDGETFSGRFVTREEAIAEGALEYEDKYFTCEGAMYEASDFFPDADSIVDGIACCAWDNAGEVADDYITDAVGLKDIAELDVELKRILNAFVEKHNLEPTFYRVIDIQEHSVVADKD